MKRIVSVAILLFVSGPTISEVPHTILHSGIGRFNSVISTDIDNDGNTEIIYGDYEGYLTVLEYRRGDFYVEWQSSSMGSRLWGLTCAKINNETVIITGDGEGRVRIIDPKTYNIIKNSESLGRDAHGLGVGDLDNDSKIEIVVGTGYKTDTPNAQLFILNENLEIMTSVGGPDYSIGSRFRGLALSDVDKDGRTEIIVGSGEALGETLGKGHMRIFEYSNNTCTLEWSSADLGGDVEGLVCTDINGDGIDEIIATTGYRYDDGYCYIFEYIANTKNVERGEFSNFKLVWQSENIGPKPYGLVVDDIDGDTTKEIVVGNQAGYIYIFDSLTHQLEWKSDLLGTDILGVTTGDIDLDSNIDIIACQGGYRGKGDFTSGYTTPHIYVIDGRMHEIKYIIGKVEYTAQIQQIVLVILIVIMFVELSILSKLVRQSENK